MSEVTVLRVPWDDERAATLRKAMDDELGPRYADRLDEVDAETQQRLAAALALDPASVTDVVIALDPAQVPIAHAALRDLGQVTPALADALEVKRVYVSPAARGTGVSVQIMRELERIAIERGRARLILQTGDRQPDAVALYRKLGYHHIDVYPPYQPITFSICMARPLTA